MMTDDEMNAVADGLDRMIDEVRAARGLDPKGLRAENERLRAALAAIGAAASADARMSRVATMASAAAGEEADWRAAYEARLLIEQRDAAREEADQLRAKLEREIAVKRAARQLLIALSGPTKVCAEADALHDALMQAMA